MWKNLSPYTLVEPDNPVFQEEQRRLRWLKTPEKLLNYNRMVWIGIPVLILFWWLIERIHVDFRFAQSDLKDRLPLILLVTIVGAMFLSSAYTVITTIGRVHRQFHAGDWEALRMTDQPETAMLAAKDAIAQIRAWPFVAVEIGLRIAFVIIVMLTNFDNANFYDSTDRAAYLQDMLLNWLCWLFYGFVLVIGLACIFEAVLRMRVLVTWSTAIALQVRPVSLALLAGFAAALLFHLSQVAVLGLLWLLLDELSRSDAGIIVFVLICLFAAGSFYVFYIGIRRMSSNFVRRKAFAPD